MNSVLYCKVINLSLKTNTTFKTKVTPVKGDFLPINYMNEVIDQVMHVTDMVVNEIPSTKGCDLLIYTR